LPQIEQAISSGIMVDLH